MSEKLVLDKDTFRALSVDSRIDILKLLAERQHTQTEIASVLGLSNSTVKEHVDILVRSSLIKQEESTRKWKYYSLTLKGKQFIQPREVQVFFAFCFAVLGSVVLAATFAWNQFTQTQQLSKEAGVMAARVSEDAVASMAMKAAPAAQADSSGWILAIILCTIVAAFFLGMLLRSPRVLIVNKKNEYAKK